MRSFFTSVRGRAYIVTFGFVALLVFFSAYLIYYSASLYGLNEKGEELKKEYAKREERAATIEGSITDSRDDIITYAEEPNRPAKCMYLSYGQLVGYNTIVDGRYGLRREFEDVLFKGDKNHHGSTIKLTTVNRIQNAAYNEIKGTEGCVVILENSTGRIIALATTYPEIEFDVNDISNTVAAFNSSKDGWTQNWLKAYAPGSTMKPLTATLIFDEGLSNEVYHDTGSEKIGGYTFHNAGKAANGNITTRKAIVKSCNTYFAHMTDKIGAYRLAERAERFGIGSDLKLDFCTVSSKHNLMNSSTVEVAAAGFGQGQLLLTPINIAMIGEAIANGGELKKPYLIDSIFNAKGTSYQGDTEEIGRVCSQEAAYYVAKAMREAAVSYGIDKKLGIRAKTGTAQVNGKYRASFLSFNDKYTVCIVENNTNKAGKSLSKSAIRLYKELSYLS